MVAQMDGKESACYAETWPPDLVDQEGICIVTTWRILWMKAWQAIVMESQRLND